MSIYQMSKLTKLYLGRSVTDKFEHVNLTEINDLVNALNCSSDEGDLFAQ